MKQVIQFTKMQGLGNDFVLIDTIRQNLPEIDLSQFAKEICDRHFGIGADGLILICSSEKNDIKMRIFNSDGSEAEMCGNGMRCFARFVYEAGIIEKELFTVETLAGVIVPALIIEKNSVVAVDVDMGEPRLKRSLIPMNGSDVDQVVQEEIVVEGQSFFVTAVSMGNPHAVIFVDDLQAIDFLRVGPLIEKHPLFPSGVNVEFVQVINKNKAAVLVWERGAGRTLACGTGACAVLIAGVLTEKMDRLADIILPGGSLKIEWLKTNNHVVLTGPANTVFSGQINI